MVGGYASTSNIAIIVAPQEKLIAFLGFTEGDWRRQIDFRQQGGDLQQMRPGPWEPYGDATGSS